MKVCLTLICLFLLTALQDGETLGTYRGNEGGSITVRCEFGYSGEKTFLCKETCEGENILIETTEDRDENGRFSIRYERRNIFSSDFLYVWITDLKPSDSGRYRCRSDETLHGTLYDDFYLVVIEDSSKPKWTPRPFIESPFIPATSTKTTIKTTTAATATTTQSQSFSPSPSETIKLSEKPAAAPDLLLYVGLTLGLLIVLLATTLLIFCQKKRFHQQKGPPVKIEPADFTTSNTVYEEIREEDRENKPPAAEISSVYVCVQPDKPNAAESNEIYSLASKPQGQTKEEDIEYSEVQLPNVAAGSNGRHLAASDNVTYSDPRLA
ncbi:uncharacterized protein LOC114140391 isoform X2 [Xiphophorus couchianus]|uniref:uncharacterized protein LOC114140391 isoform X2 n=1 Tax=Xiphophorus couchianus TaxID=32473 RepID=UPI00101602D5|nr:natural cytotoxicity triggering receptor 2 isoform X2 [Xiphophorus couchianus]XP_027866008.1 natural cytotoxicity triggering receptor 2 isoform X2 [Xiphophorus couchianus]